jgi:hypothetical protein
VGGVAVVQICLLMGLLCKVMPGRARGVTAAIAATTTNDSEAAHAMYGVRHITSVCLEPEGNTAGRGGSKCFEVWAGWG